jgi:hypothetical protein
MMLRDRIEGAERMRVFLVVCALSVLTIATAAQAPAAKPAPAPAAQAPGAKPKPAAPAAPGAAAKPVGTLAQIMRGIFFPNSNILFDVQSNDPAGFGKKTEGAGATGTFSGIYTGWQVVENAAIALEEGARLLEVRGRMCENGRPVPLDQKDWPGFIADLRKASQAMLKAAQSRNRELASETTNDVAGACENCHTKYRDANPRCTP